MNAGRRRHAGMVMAAVIMFMAMPCTAAETASADEPLTIQSDRLDAFDDSMKVIFSGNVVVTKRDITMTSDVLHVFYRRDKEGVGAVTQQNPVAAGTVTRIEAEGSVAVVQGDKKITGDHAVFFNEAQRIEVAGNVQMRDGKNVIEGEKATFFIAENRGVVESSPSKRVKAVIYSGTEKMKQ